MHLFVSDLDGTLLNSAQNISDFTVDTINSLIEECSLNFTIATARSLESAWPIISRLNLKLPLILHNGAFFYDPVTKKYLVKNVISHTEITLLVEEFEKRNLNPIVYSTNDSNLNKVFYKGIFNNGERDYFQKKIDSNDRRLVLREKHVFQDRVDAISVNAIDTEQNLSELSSYIEKTGKFHVHFARDIYSGFFWLEITNCRANKGAALQDMKVILQATLTSTFGDNLNDLPMFEESDFKYAVSNAHRSLKDISTKVLGSNDNDGVAMFLKAQFG